MKKRSGCETKKGIENYQKNREEKNYNQHRVIAFKRANPTMNFVLLKTSDDRTLKEMERLKLHTSELLQLSYRHESKIQ